MRPWKAELLCRSDLVAIFEIEMRSVQVSIHCDILWRNEEINRVRPLRNNIRKISLLRSRMNGAFNEANGLSIEWMRSRVSLNQFENMNLIVELGYFSWIIGKWLRRDELEVEFNEIEIGSRGFFYDGRNCIRLVVGMRLGDFESRRNGIILSWTDHERRFYSTWFESNGWIKV